MAATKGQGNPKWTRDETVLALELYLDLQGRSMSANDSRVIALSRELRQLAFDAHIVGAASFRNPDGVAFKLLNICSVATGRGFSNASKVDREVWTSLGGDRELVREIAGKIRARDQSNLLTLQEGGLEEPEFMEGRTFTRIHSCRERRPGLRKLILEKRGRLGSIQCDCCRVGPPPIALELGLSVFELHHLVPLSAFKEERATLVEDVAVLCANCHRLMHAMVRKHGRWLTAAELKASLLLP